MNVPEYTPGDWYAVVTPGVVLLLAPSTPPEVVRDVWAGAPAQGGGLGTQLDALVRHGIGGLHPFAAVDLTTGAVQTALRGDVEVEVVRGTRAEVLAAPRVVSWSERAVGAADEVTVRVAGAGRGPALPLVSGIVRASRVRVRITGAEPVPAGAGTPADAVAGPVLRATEPARSTATTVRRADAPVPVLDVPGLPEGSGQPEGSGLPGGLGLPGGSDAAALLVPSEEAVPLEVAVLPDGSVAHAAGVPADVEPALPAWFPVADEGAGDPAVPAASGAAPVPDASPVPSPPALPALPLDRAQPVDHALSAGHALPVDRALSADHALSVDRAQPAAPVLPHVPAAASAAVTRPDPEDSSGAPASGADETTLLPELLPALPGPASADDHDGLTILSGELASIRQNLPSWAVSQTGEWPSGPVVPVPLAGLSGTAVLPGTAPGGGGLAQATVPLLALSTGALVPVDGVVLIGRAPRADRAPDGVEPRLVTVPSPEQDISRTHAEVRLQLGRVLVTDLYSTNGITVAGGGLPPRRVTAGEPVVVGDGDVVDLGDGVTFTVEPGA